MVIALMDCLNKHSMKLRKWKNLKLDRFQIPSILGRSSLLRIVITLRITTILITINLGINLILRILQCRSSEALNQRNMKMIKKIHINQQQSRKTDLITFLFSENSEKLQSRNQERNRKQKTGKNINTIRLFRKKKNIRTFSKVLRDWNIMQN